MLKASILWGEGGHAAGYVRSALGDACDSPPSCYALAIAALVQGDDEAALPAIEGMRGGDEAFGRTADAMAALVHGDARRLRGCRRGDRRRLRRARGPTSPASPFADTAVMLERLAAPRGLAAQPASSLMPVLG